MEQQSKTLMSENTPLIGELTGTVSNITMTEERNNKVLIIDNDVTTSSLTQKLLIDEGFDVTVYNDALEALCQAEKEQYQLILLELVFPNLDGFELIRKIRLNNKTPMMIMSKRDDVFDKIYALEIGADDYLTKPFNQREMLARINALVRRSRIVNTFSTHKSLEVNDIQLCLSTREVKCAGQLLTLTGYEFEVLNFLISNAGSVMSKDKIGEHVLGRAIPYNDRSIDMHISNIRKKIAAIAPVQKIKTVRGAGYVFLKASVQ